MPPLSIPPRTTTLDPDTPLAPTLDLGHPWWTEIRPMSPNAHFEDVGPAVLELERLVDSAPLGPRPVLAGCYGSSARACAESPFAEPDFESEGPRPLLEMLRRRVHPLDRH